MSTIFDLLDDTEVKKEVRASPKAPQDIFDIAMEVQAEPAPEEMPWYKSIPLDALKGIVEGVARVGRMMGPTRAMPG